MCKGNEAFYDRTQGCCQQAASAARQRLRQPFEDSAQSTLALNNSSTLAITVDNVEIPK